MSKFTTPLDDTIENPEDALEPTPPQSKHSDPLAANTDTETKSKHTTPLEKA